MIYLREREREKRFPTPHFVSPLTACAEEVGLSLVVDFIPNHLHDTNVYLSFYKVPSYFIYSLMM